MTAKTADTTDDSGGVRFPRAPDDLAETLEGDHDLAAIADTWELIPEISDRPFNSYAGWRHAETGLTVTVETQARPRQMHTPETSTDDTGWIASARGGQGQGGEQLTHNLGSKLHAYQTACRLMATFPDGDFEPEYRDVEWEGPRDPEDWQ